MWIFLQERIIELFKNMIDKSRNTKFSEKEVNNIYKEVFRQSTVNSGFCYFDFGKEIDSKSFRQVMVNLKESLSEICTTTLNKKLIYQSIGRFNHQNSSRFHRDTAENHSFLMLGYEPTKVDSKVYVADYSKYIEVQNIPLLHYFENDEANNTIKNYDGLEPYITELNPFSKNHFRLLIVNNSKSFTEKTYGVFHRGEIPNKLEQENRVLNYMMLHLCDNLVEERYSNEIVNDFINTKLVNR